MDALTNVVSPERKIAIMHSARAIHCLAGILLSVLLVAPVVPEDVPPLPKSAEPAFPVSAAERAKIEKALPAKSVVTPAKRRKLLIFDLNVGYPGHRSMAHAEVAFTRMGKRTGAFDTVISRDPAVFEPQTLRQFDAVYFNNTVGNLFTDPRLRKSLIEFVYAGGGVLGTHGATVAFTRWPGAHEDWPEFGRMLGARGASHRDSDEHVFAKFDEPDHPLNRPFGGSFHYRDEFFRVHGPYSRDRVRVLFGIDTEKTDMNQGRERGVLVRDDDDYALAWVRNYGRGRVFYCTIGHNSYVFSDPLMLKFYLGAIQFALGDLPAPTMPSARLTAATRAQEKLGWRLGVTAYSFHKYTAFEAIEKTAELGLPFFGGLSFQKVSKDIPKNFDAGLTDDEIRKIRLKLDAAGVRLLTFYYHDIPANEAQCRRIFEFGRKLGIETFISEPKLEALDTIERFCDAYDIKLAIHNHGKKLSPHYWHPEELAKICRGRSKRIGSCADIGYWLRSGIDPVAGVKALGERLLSLQLHDLNEPGPEGHDVPWGAGDGRTGKILEALHHLGIAPTMFGLEYSYDWFDSMPEMAESVQFFNRASLRLAGAAVPTGDA